MKRLFFGTLSALVFAILTLTGCGTKKATPDPSNETNIATEADSAITDSESDPASAPDQALDSPDEQEPKTAAELSEEAQLLMGKLVDGVYSNDYVGFKIQLPTNWSALSPETIQEMSGNSGVDKSGIVVAYAFPGEVANFGDGDANFLMVSIEKAQADQNLTALLQAQQANHDDMNKQMVASQSSDPTQPSITKNEMNEWEKDGHVYHQLVTKLETPQTGAYRQITYLFIEAGDYIVSLTQCADSPENEIAIQSALETFAFTKKATEPKQA